MALLSTLPDTLKVLSAFMTIKCCGADGRAFRSLWMIDTSTASAPSINQRSSNQCQTFHPLPLRYAVISFRVALEVAVELVTRMKLLNAAPSRLWPLSLTIAAFHQDPSLRNL